MSAGSVTTGGTLDLEKELSCSICTDILYQPLTLLDCLHTFCGSCLKEWFSWQATAGAEQRNSHPYTCPSCRASVRAARPNANVTTLLEMYLQANPTKGKSDEEKAEMRTHYKPGDDVLPPVILTDRSDDDSEDERLLEQVREISVADLDPAVEANRRSERASRQRRARGGNSPRDREIRRREVAETARQRQDAVERNVSHQPSLRSLLNASGEDSAEIQEEILTSILSSGMLDGVDIDNLTTEQEEELIERIAEAYRRRHRDGHGSRRETTPASTDGAQREVTQAGEAHTTPRSRPSVPRPHLIDQWTQEPSRSSPRPPSSSSQTRTESSNVRATTAGTPDRTADHNAAERQQFSAVRSSATGSHMTTPPRPGPETTDRNTQHDSAERQVRASAEQRSNTDPVRPGSSRSEIVRSTQHSAQRRSTDSHHEPRRPAVAVQQRASSIPTQVPQTLPYPLTDRPHATQNEHPQPQQRSQDSQHAVQLAITIPEVKCNRCERPNIQNKLHYHCDKCTDGDFDLCLQCYRSGAGCNNWWGFGYAAQARFERNAPPEGWPRDYEHPHVLSARRYQRHEEFDARTQDLATCKPLQEGAFCERCLRCANDRYWHCVVCMEGAWGFCDDCVHRGNHCTHPLLPTSLRPNETPSSTSVPLPHIKTGAMVFMPPTVSCAICHQSISRHDTHLHCSSCNNGNYDMCTSCHRSLIAAGKITSPPEARQCLQGHSMMLVQFQPTPGGIERRLVLADADSSTATAAASGAGRSLALWSWFPAEGIDDELTFPKNAEIRGVVKMNEDYNVGRYAGDIGLFPANHVRPL